MLNGTVLQLDPTTLRLLKRLQLRGGEPIDALQRDQLHNLVARMTGIYSKAFVLNAQNIRFAGCVLTSPLSESASLEPNTDTFCLYALIGVSASLLVFLVVCLCCVVCLCAR